MQFSFQRLSNAKNRVRFGSIPRYQVNVTLWAIGFLFLSFSQSSAVDYLYASNGNNTIIRYDVSLSTGTAIEASVQTFIANPGNSPSGLAFDSSGNLFVAASGSNAVNKFDSSGNLLASITSNVNYPFSLSIDASNNLYTLNGLGNTVTKYDSSNTYLNTISGNIVAPRSVANDTAGNVYVLNGEDPFSPTANDNKLLKFNGSTGLYDSTVISTLSFPQDLAIDSANNYFVVTFSSINKFAPDGTSLSTFGSGGFRLALDKNGNTFVYDGNSIQKYDPSGAYVVSWSTTTYSIQGMAVQSVPEPSTYALAAIATGVMGYVARRRKARGV